MKELPITLHVVAECSQEAPLWRNKDIGISLSCYLLNSVPFAFEKNGFV
jgi:hypothetical protein